MEREGGPVFPSPSGEGRSTTHPTLLDQAPNFPGFICRVMIGRWEKRGAIPSLAGVAFQADHGAVGICSRAGRRVEHFPPHVAETLTPTALSPKEIYSVPWREAESRVSPRRSPPRPGVGFSGILSAPPSSLSLVLMAMRVQGPCPETSTSFCVSVLGGKKPFSALPDVPSSLLGQNQGTCLLLNYHG